VREVLYLGRLHPKKSVDMLIEAWGRVTAQRRAGWRLRIVGPNENGCGDFLKRLAASHTLAEVVVEPPIYGHSKLDAYRRADLFVLPTRNENFGITVAEALAAGTPAISTQGAPWAGLETERCGWWPPHGVESMTAMLGTALAMPTDELRAMGERGRAWMAREFSWDVVAARLLEVGAWLRDGGTPPAAITPE
jgi:glycosyltransferase involved in cell wall biosynthesis